MGKRAVMAIGGNAITRPDQGSTIPELIRSAEQSCRSLTALLQQGYDVVLTHGNGAQVGSILLRVELSAHEVHPVPLDVCVAESQGSIGYILQRRNRNAYPSLKQ